MNHKFLKTLRTQWKKFLFRKRILLAIILSALFLYIAFRSFDPEKIIQSISQIKPIYFIHIFLLIFLTMLIHALRWKHIINKIKKIKTSRLFEAMMISHFTNIVLPINIGTLIRAYFIKKKEKVSLSSVLGTIAIERIASIFAYLFILIYILLFVEFTAELSSLQANLRKIGIISLGFFILLIVLILALKKFKYKALSLTQKISKRFLPKYTDNIQRVLNLFILGLNAGKTKIDFTFVLLYSIIIRILYAVTILFIAKSFGISLPLTTFLLIDILVTFAHTIGGHLLGVIGTYEAAMAYSLVLYGVPKETGLGIALLLDITWFIPLFAIGFYYVWKEGINFFKYAKNKQNL